MSGGGAGSLMNKSAKEGKELLDKYFEMFDGLKTAIEQSRKILYSQGYVEDVVGRRRRLPDINLPKYSVTLKDNNTPDAFNPFLNCKNRDDITNPKIANWTAIINQTIEQRAAEAIKRRKSWVPSELSNDDYTNIAKQAFNDGVSVQANTGRIAQAERQCFNARIQGSAGTLTKQAMLDIFKDEELKKYDAHLIITVHDEVLVECKEEYADLVEKRLPEIMVNAALKLGINAPKMKCDPYCVGRWYADTAAVAIRDEFKKLELGDEKKGIAPVSREKAFKIICENHLEAPEEAIKNVIETGCDLEF